MDNIHSVKMYAILMFGLRCQKHIFSRTSSKYDIKQLKQYFERREYMETFSNLISQIDGILWGLPLIIILCGTHLFMTFRTGRSFSGSLGKGIRLSVTKDTDGEGEISQFGALTTALAATIGTRQYHRCGYSGYIGRSGSRSLDVADRRIRHGDKIL